MITTVTSKGQITLPKSIREKLNLQTGARVDFILEEKTGRAIMQPLQRKIDDVFGLLAACKKKKRKCPIAEMDKGIARAVKLGSHEGL